MGWTIILEQEDGYQIRMLAGEFDFYALDKLDLGSFIILKHMDYYGDTTINRLQLDDLKKDFEQLRSIITGQDDIIREILGLIEESRARKQAYIKFYGD